MCKTSTCINCQYVPNGEESRPGGWGLLCRRKAVEEALANEHLLLPSDPGALGVELKKVIEKERVKLQKKAAALDAAEANQEDVSAAISKILLDEASMAAMLSYGKSKDPANVLGKEVSEKFKQLQEHMTPALKEKVRKFMLERVKVQFKKDAKAAEKYMKATLDKMAPELLPKFFKTHDYNKGKGAE